MYPLIKKVYLSYKTDIDNKIQYPTHINQENGNLKLLGEKTIDINGHDVKIQIYST
jgi:hypothetical protein